MSISYASFGQYLCLLFFGHFYTTMEGEEESLQLRIDVSLDQDKDENQEIIYSQSSENSDVDVLTLKRDCPPSSSSSSSDGTISELEHVEIVSPSTLQKCPNLLARGSPFYHLQRDATISSTISTHQSQPESIHIS